MTYRTFGAVGRTETAVLRQCVSGNVSTHGHILHVMLHRYCTGVNVPDLLIRGLACLVGHHCTETEVHTAGNNHMSRWWEFKAPANAIRLLSGVLILFQPLRGSQGHSYLAHPEWTPSHVHQSQACNNFSLSNGTSCWVVLSLCFAGVRFDSPVFPAPS